jgi:hypothetical protein
VSLHFISALSTDKRFLECLKALNWRLQIDWALCVQFRGFYCPMGSVNGNFNRCPAGSYGAMKVLFTNLCSAGYHCYEGSTSLTVWSCI